MILAPPSWGDLGVISAVLSSAAAVVLRFSRVETKVDLMYKWFQDKVIGGR